MPITTSTNSKRELTVFTLTGKIIFDDIFQAVKYYHEGLPTSFALCDARQATGNLSTEQIHEINSYVWNFTPKRPNGKTAFIVKNKHHFDLAQMEASLVQIAGLPVEFRVFYSESEGLEWLGPKWLARVSGW